jgi:3',5'-cyclic AMP phosphodiesterase CpdA
MSDAVRLIHFSDVHITSKPLGWRGRDLASKRFTGWLNLRLLGRGRRFRHAPHVAEKLVGEIKQRRPDHLIFSGDATSLAFESEFKTAARALAVDDPDMPPGLAIPGNHDCYVKRPVKERLFERYFAPWQKGERVDGEVYPFAQRVGSLWLIGVNSSSYNFWTWDARGRIDRSQLERLRALLAKLSPGPRILVTHYPLARSKGQPERRLHGLRNWRTAMRVASEGGVSLWLHGHLHRPFALESAKAAPFPIICAGSATQTGIWAYNEYRVAGERLEAVRRVFSPGVGAFQDRDSFEVDIRTGTGAVQV